MPLNPQVPNRQFEWNDAISGSDGDIFYTGFIQMYVDAEQERRNMLDFNTATPHQIVEGNYPAHSDWLDNTNYGIGYIQNRVRSIFISYDVYGEGWLKEGIDIESKTSLSDADFYIVVDDILGHYFRRKYWREYWDFAPDVYHYGDNVLDIPRLPQNGDKARNLTDGKTYLRVGGAWVLTTGLPDFVETFGDIYPGDIYGTWLYEDCRTVLNKLTRYWKETYYFNWKSDGTNNNHDSAQNSADATWADAKSNAEANWGGVNLSRSDDVEPYSFSEGGVDAFSQFNASLTKHTARLQLVDDYTDRSKTYKYYIFAKPPTLDPSYTFDDGGDDVVNGSYHKFDEIAWAKADTPCPSKMISDISTKPPWCSQPSVGTNTKQGWSTFTSGVLIVPNFEFHA